MALSAAIKELQFAWGSLCKLGGIQQRFQGRESVLTWAEVPWDSKPCRDPSGLVSFRGARWESSYHFQPRTPNTLQHDFGAFNGFGVLTHSGWRRSCLSDWRPVSIGGWRVRV